MKRLVAIRWGILAFMLTATGPSHVRGQLDDAPAAVIPRLIPPAGELDQADRQRLREELRKANQAAERVRRDPLYADVEVLLKAVALGIRHNEFYSQKDVSKALRLIALARTRTELLEQSKSPWTSARGRVVRGYRSTIDRSSQPIGLEIPAGLDLSQPVTMYVWLHGRGDKSTDMHFIAQRLDKNGQLKLDDAIVMHPFGRHCVGFKSAGEIDVLEAVEFIQSQYNIDPDRIVLMGFSMGGAGVWHLGAHYPDRWVAMSPGAGFAETAKYNRLKPADYPPAYEQRLWGLYDVPRYARNLLNLPVVAYSGENDRQIQAARVMEAAFAEHEKELTHIIGPGMGHKYHPDSLTEIQTRMRQAAHMGLDRDPPRVHLQTQTLRYNRVHWLEALRLGEHWRDARIDAGFGEDNDLNITTKNVASLRVHGERPVRKIWVNGQLISMGRNEKRPLTFSHIDGHWQLGELPNQKPLAKVHKLQGPIDDAFLSSFLVVLPSKKSGNKRLQQWVEFEQQHMIDRWRALFRGEPRVKTDTAVTTNDMRSHNLILWGDPTSNSVLNQVSELLPIKWGRHQIQVGEKQFDCETHVPVMIHPNPLAPWRYIVLNSGPTFREGHDRTNSLQNPKLPDWSILDIRTVPTKFVAGEVVAAGFFGENWQLK